MLGVVADAFTGRRTSRSAVPGAGPSPELLSGAAMVAGAALDRLGRDRKPLHIAGTALVTWGVLRGAALASRGATLVRELETGHLDAARRTLASIDPRCTESLDRVGLTRASVEAVAENTSASVVGPLLWGALAGTPGMLVHRGVKAAKALAARRRGRNRKLATAADRADELVDLLPTRYAAALTVVAAPVVGGSARGAWVAWRRDAAAHPSPNAGRVEAAFAGALEIRLGGRTVYPDRVQELPVLGAGRNPDTGHVTRAVELSRLVAWLGAISSAMLAIAFQRRQGHR